VPGGELPPVSRATATVAIVTLAPVPPSLLRAWDVPTLEPGASLNIEARAGETTIIVGANGAGKSELGRWLDRDGYEVTRRVSAHRQLWFSSPGPGITAERYDQLTNAASHWRTQTDARFIDHVGAERTGIVLFDLLSQVIVDNDTRVSLFQEGATNPAVLERLGPRPLDRLNNVLAAGGLLVRVKVNAGQGFDAVREDTRAVYPISQMSDGEKSAVLLAAEILASKKNSVQIVDEPERHLHRAISTQVIQAVVASRPDCHFVLLTHELDLAAELTQQSAHTFILSASQWAGGVATGWELNRLDSGNSLPVEARTAILGGRRKLVFIEGKSGSVDPALYRVLYPNRQFVSSNGSTEVLRSVTGLHDAQDHHWIEALGIVDGDHRSAEEIEKLRSRFVTPLPVAEVENLYYVDEVMDAVAHAYLPPLEKDAVEGLAQARAEGFKVLAKEAARLTEELALTALRRRMSEKLPTEIDSSQPTYTATVDSPYADIWADVQSHIVANNLSELVRLLPVRNTPFRDTVARRLGFQNALSYQAYARTQIQKQPELAEKLRKLINLSE